MAIMIQREGGPSQRRAGWRHAVENMARWCAARGRSTASMLLVLCLPALLAACGGGSKADPPPSVQALAGDLSVTLTWQAESGVEYWVFYAPDPSISPDNFVTVPGSKVLRNVNSPQTIVGLVN